MGNIALWKYSPPTTGRKVDGENKWKLQTPATVEGPVQQVHVSFMYEMFTCQCNKNRSIYSHQQVSHVHDGDFLLKP